jgi:hypothetical protein
MIGSGSDYRIIHVNSFIWVLVIISGLLVFKKGDYNSTDYRHHADPAGTSVVHRNAAVSTDIQYYQVQKIWIANKGNFRLFTFGQTKFLDNKKAELKILISDKITENSIGFPLPLIHYKSFPKEDDEIPILS